MWFIFSTNTHLLLLLCGISFDISLYKNSSILALMELVIYLRGIAKADGHRTVSEMVMSCAYGCAGSRQDVEEGVRESLVGKVTFALRLLHGVRRSQALKATRRSVRSAPSPWQPGQSEHPQGHFSSALQLCDGDSLQKKRWKEVWKLILITPSRYHDVWCVFVQAVLFFRFLLFRLPSCSSLTWMPVPKRGSSSGSRETKEKVAMVTGQGEQLLPSLQSPSHNGRWGWPFQLWVCWGPSSALARFPTIPFSSWRKLLHPRLPRMEERSQTA